MARLAGCAAHLHLNLATGARARRSALANSSRRGNTQACGTKTKWSHHFSYQCCCVVRCCWRRYSQGQKFGKHIDDSVEVEGAPGHVTGYTLLVYLSGGTQQQQGPIDVSAPKASPNSSSSSQAGGSKAKRQKGAAAAAVSSSSSSSQPAQLNSNALQELVGGETVFYGEADAPLQSSQLLESKPFIM